MNPSNPALRAFLPAIQTQPRSPEALNRLTDAMSLETSPRYAIRDTTGDGKVDTFCNIALWDWSRGMGAEIPHWVDASGNPAEPFAAGAHELSANNTARWLAMHGPRFGWNMATKAQARVYALAGKPACVTWINPTGASGHVAWLRGNQPDPGVIRTAQAGKVNFSNGTLAQGFGSAGPVAFWIHE